MRSEDNKALREKNNRRFKTAAQVDALEKFYNEHKYPSESMKLQLAESIQLTEKQISGWFCHRRSKDKKLLLNGEAVENGRQDRSSGVVQDSCGSTKQGDKGHFEPREVESRRLTGQDFDTSSGSSSPLQNQILAQNESPLHMSPSRYVMQNRNIDPIGEKDGKTRNGPSGYLKVKGQVENAAITAVKRQLGRQYQEDGPPLGVEFQPLPPGAFESSPRDPVNEPYYIGDPILPPSLDVPIAGKQPNPGRRYEVHNSKTSSYDSDLDWTSFKSMHGSNHHENYSHRQSKKKYSLTNNRNPFPGQNSIEMNENSAGETPVYDSSRSYGMRATFGLEGTKTDSGSSHHRRPYCGNINNDQTEPSLHPYSDVNHYDAKKECFQSRPTNLKRKTPRGLVKDDKLYSERRAINEYCDPVRLKTHPATEIRVTKSVRDEFSPQQYPRKASGEETPTQTNQIERSAREIPSSLSEDETAETSSSLD